MPDSLMPAAGCWVWRMIPGVGWAESTDEVCVVVPVAAGGKKSPLKLLLLQLGDCQALHIMLGGGGGGV